MKGVVEKGTKLAYAGLSSQAACGMHIDLLLLDLPHRQETPVRTLV